MKHASRRGLRGALGASVFVLAAAAFPAASEAAPDAAGSPYQVDVEYYKLPNGLKVVLSRDTTRSRSRSSASTTTSASASSRKDRTGFAHLFEHMMFQGSENLGKMEFIKLVQCERRDR